MRERLPESFCLSGKIFLMTLTELLFQTISLGRSLQMLKSVNE